MMLWLRNIFLYLVGAIASASIARWVNSTVAMEILVPNLTSMVVALLAINVQTTAVMAVKLNELAEKRGLKLGRVVKEFKLAIWEQLVLVGISLALVTMSKAKPEIVSSLSIEITAFFTFIASLHIFLDTTLGLFEALCPDE